MRNVQVKSVDPTVRIGSFLISSFNGWIVRVAGEPGTKQSLGPSPSASDCFRVTDWRQIDFHRSKGRGSRF